MEGEKCRNKKMKGNKVCIFWYVFLCYFYSFHFERKKMAWDELDSPCTRGKKAQSANTVITPKIKFQGQPCGMLDKADDKGGQNILV